MQCAKRKDNEDNRAAVQTCEHFTQEHERAVEQQQQRYQQAQRTRDVTFANDHGFRKEHQPAAYGYSKQVTIVPFTPPPNSKKLGPQVDANNGPSQLHTRQLVIPYPSLQTGLRQVVPGITNVANAIAGQIHSPSNRSDKFTALSTFGYDAHTSSQYPDSMRFDDPYPTGGNTDEVPFISVTSPLASKSLIVNQKNGVRLQNQAAVNGAIEQIPAPVVVATYTRTSPPSPSEAPASADVESKALGSTMQSRINDVWWTDTNDTMSSRISVGPTDRPYLLGKTGGPLSTYVAPGASKAEDSYAWGPTRRSRLVAGNVSSLNSSALSNSLLSSPSSSLYSGQSYETLDFEAFKSVKSTVLGAVLTHGSSRSIGSDYSSGRFEDTERFGSSGLDFKRQNSGNDCAMTPRGQIRGDIVTFDRRDSVEF
ncbi:unnamed protein product [Peronospora belbahrii]|uniref:Uncharacterized protein n=1 Tax=Peronospora belbahrii TaxID=622444 RepID=A0AAU9KZE1_9STRA|nr:unnamed protein product [Peronospora belbahrii]CAH0478687.1 unnamed protein product [Peronospora belbahrii]CAH0514686.1 unnamed protein product [Peronospora belbahrii]